LSDIGIWTRYIACGKLFFWGCPSIYCLPKSELIYPIKIELEFDASALFRKENKEEKRDFKGKAWTPYLGLLIALPSLLNLRLAFSGGPS